MSGKGNEIVSVVLKETGNNFLFHCYVKENKETEFKAKRAKRQYAKLTSDQSKNDVLSQSEFKNKTSTIKVGENACV